MLHNSYQLRGGEDVVVEQEYSMLRSRGLDVFLDLTSNNAIHGVTARARTAFQTGFNSQSAATVRRRIAEVRPDVVHIHNFFPLLSASVHQVARQEGVAVVQTMHNYRTLCAAAIFAREGKVCELCLHGSRLNALRYRCYRNSMVGTAAVVNMQRIIKKRNLLSDNVHQFIALSGFAKKKLVEGGFPADRISIKPNFLASMKESLPVDPDNRHGALYVGRLSPEKGLSVLLDAWRSLGHVPLRIAGDGPLKDELLRNLPSGVIYLGQLSPADIKKEMMAAAMLILPSTCYEGLPMTIVEAYSVGLPVIASRLGSMAEIVQNHQTGLHFEPGSASDLVRAVYELNENSMLRKNMSMASIEYCRANYSEERNFSQTIDIYERAIALARLRQGRKVSA